MRAAAASMSLREIIALMRKRFDADPGAKRRQGAFFPDRIGPHCRFMQIHGSCAARDGAGVLLMGPPGRANPTWLLRLLDRGFDLVADDQVEIEDGMRRRRRRSPGLLEVRGLGIVRLPHAANRPGLLWWSQLAAERAAAAGAVPARTRSTCRLSPSTRPPPPPPQRVALALDCALGRASQSAGAFAHERRPS